ncbi:MAG: peptidoglycan DD-metalloendopeptidase family protein [Flavobacteriaceae bacterium]
MKKRLLLFFLVLGAVGYGQQKSAAQKELEERKAALTQEIAQITEWVKEQQQVRGSVVDRIRILDRKQSALENLIALSAREVQFLQRQIDQSSNEINSLEVELRRLKEDYARVIQSAYQKKLEKNKLLFLLSASSFNEARRRMNYLLQYAEYRTIQAKRIEEKQVELQEKEKALQGQLEAQQEKIAENQLQRDELESDKRVQERLVAETRKQERKYRAELASREKERKRIDQEIDRLIREAIARANREKAKANSNAKDAFVLTPEAKRIAASFEANKGRHLWPVEKGIKSIGYGTYADKLYPSLKHFNNGVTIATASGAKARAIFEGEVMQIMSNRQGIKGVYVRHGDYITMYYNLAEVFVSKGQQLEAKQEIGRIHTDQVDKQTTLKFYLYQNTTRLNPELWVYQL